MKIYKNFVSFEGIDFSGKTTQIERLLARLRQHGLQPTLVREPGGTTISEKIRDILLSSDHGEMYSKTELLLYEAARAQLVHQALLPLLESGQLVIADRFFDSSTAYQGCGRHLDLTTVKTINLFATSGLRPYRTFFIDITPDLAEKRQHQVQHQQDRLEKSGKEFFMTIREGFLNLCREEPERFIRIDGGQDPETISRQIWDHIRTIWEI